MKRLIVFAACVFLVLLIVGCGVAEVSILEPAVGGVGLSNSRVVQIETPPTLDIDSFEEDVSEPDLQVTASTAATSAAFPTKDGREATPVRLMLETPLPTPTVEWTGNQQYCRVRTEWPTYIVQRGDTLAHIAGQAQTTVATLTTANCLTNPDRIIAGQSIYIPQQVAVIPSPTATPASQWVHYMDSTYQAEIDYPGTWRQTADGINIRFEGADGFVQLLAIGANSDLDTVTNNEAFHKLMPYGSTPIIQRYHLHDGREAHLILPSADQQGSMKGQAALITRYAEPVEILGSAYNYFQLVTDVAHIQYIANSLRLPAPAATISIEEFNAETQDLATGGKRLKFRWVTSGATRATIISGTAERFAPWWNVDASGELTVEIEHSQFADPTMTLLAVNDVSGEETSQTLSIPWPCQPSYFFESTLKSCPRAASQTLPGVFQQFQRGFMVWLHRPEYGYPSIYVFHNSGELRFFEDTWTDNEPEHDSEPDPPEGMNEPVRGFGKVWRESDWVRESLGWAIDAEFGYEVTFQSGANESLQDTSYLTHPDSTIIQLNSFSWQFYSEG
jgi:hypothetical protein